MDACKESFLKYLLIHGRKDGSSPLIRSFFKVMINKRFSDILFLPPKFAKELSFSGNEVQVEDISGSGRQWTMSLCFVDGYLSFGEGWHDFATDHGIEFGDIVIVHHILNARFVVQVYEKSGCEKLPDPSTPHNTMNKRSGTCRASMDKDSAISIHSDVNMDINQDNNEGFPESQLSDSTDGIGVTRPISEDPYDKQGNNEDCSEADLSDSTNGEGVKRPFVEDACCIVDRDIDPVPKDLGDSTISTNGKGVKRPFVEDPCCIIDRDIDPTSKDDVKRCFFDLSEFETCSTAKTVCKNRSVPVQDGGFSDPVEENIFSSFEENIIEYADFDAPMRIPCDGGNNDICSKDGEIPKQVLQETFPSMSALSATDHKMKDACVSTQPSQEAQTATVEDQADVKECKDFNLKCSVGERAQLGGSVKRTKNKHNKFKSEQFGRNVGIVKKEGKEFNPEGLGGSVRIAKKEPNDYSPGAFGQSGGSVRMGKNVHKEFNPGVSVKKVKKELNGFNPNNFGMNPNANEHIRENRASGSRPALKRVKAEAVDFAEPSPRLQVKCLVESDNDLFIELPKNFWSLGDRGSMGVEEKVYQTRMVYLRGSANRLWPVLYQKHMGLRALTSGWKSFKEANGIQAGDECVFALENESEGIYRVNTVRK